MEQYCIKMYESFLINSKNKLEYELKYQHLT